MTNPILPTEGQTEQFLRLATEVRAVFEHEQALRMRMEGLVDVAMSLQLSTYRSDLLDNMATDVPILVETPIDVATMRHVLWEHATAPLMNAEIFGAATSAALKPCRERFLQADAGEGFGGAPLMTDCLRLRNLYEMAMVAARTMALYSEDYLDMLEEATHAAFPQANDSFVALLEAELPGADPNSDPDDRRRSISRRRNAIDKRIGMLIEPCRRELLAQLDDELSKLPPESDRATALAMQRRRSSEPNAPYVRLIAKRWFNFSVMARLAFLPPDETWLLAEQSPHPIE
jgi:hypothetical protein